MSDYPSSEFAVFFKNSHGEQVVFRPEQNSYEEIQLMALTNPYSKLKAGDALKRHVTAFLKNREIERLAREILVDQDVQAAPLAVADAAPKPMETEIVVQDSITEGESDEEIARQLLAEQAETTEQFGTY